MHTLVLPYRGDRFERQGEGFFCALDELSQSAGHTLRPPTASLMRLLPPNDYLERRKRLLLSK